MADAFGIEWGNIQSPNVLGSYLQGQQYRQEQEANALARQRQATLDDQNAQEFTLKKQAYGDKQAEAERTRRAEFRKSSAMALYTVAKTKGPEALAAEFDKLVPTFKMMDPQATDEDIAGLRQAVTTNPEALRALAEIKPEEGYTLSPGSARYEGTTKVAEQPFAPSFQTLGPGQTLVEVSRNGAAAPAPAGGDWRQALAEAVPDARVTSGFRSAEHNAEVGGKPNSRHLTGEAVDLVPKPGETMGQLYARVAKVPGVKALNEGDHVHVQVSDGQAPQVQGGARIVAQGAPKADDQTRPATAEEKAAYGIPADVPAKINGKGDIQVITGTAARLKPVPAQIQGGYKDNAAAIKQIDDAIAEIRRNPGAMGMANMLGDEVRQRLDPKGVGTRASVANIGSLIIHDRSGAAVTAAETPRLKPFIPMPTDRADAAITKLQGLRQQYVNNNNQIAVQYGEDTGYAPIGGAKPAPPRTQGPAPAAKSGGLPQAARAQLKSGQITTFANGQRWTIRNGQPVRIN